MLYFLMLTFFSNKDHDHENEEILKSILNYQKPSHHPHTPLQDHHDNKHHHHEMILSKALKVMKQAASNRNVQSLNIKEVYFFLFLQHVYST